MKSLDALSLRYLRRWLNLPQCATRPVMTSTVFDFGQVSVLAEKSRVGSHARMRERADERVQHVLDVKIARESKLKRESMQPTVRAESIYQEVKQASPAASKKQIIKSARDRVVSNHEQECKSH